MIELRVHERKTLDALDDLRGKASLEQLVESAKLSDSAVMRAVLTLQGKGMVETSERKQTLVKLTSEGKASAKYGLPERRLASALEKLNGKASLEDVVAESRLEKQLVPIAIGWIQRKKWATLDPKTKMLQMSADLQKGSDERLLELLAEAKQAVLIEELNQELQKVVSVLKGRKLLEVDVKSRRIIELTKKGREISRKGLKALPEVTQITPELIISGNWRKVKLHAYDVEAPVHITWPGKKHPYMQFLDEVKEKLVALGFKEMVGTVVETSFFNFDALYTPQGHSARDPSSVYFIKSPKYGRTETEKKVLTNVKKTHENGWKTGSRGWRSDYSNKEATRLILRSHTTCLSARTLLSKDLEIPGKYFSIGRCYRPEVLDKTHLTEFNQVEGIVVEEDLTLRDLLGILEKFAMEIAGADEARFVPDYFPFTEPSIELRAYKKNYGWIEFGGSGIFRPEVTMPLGIRMPVLAWGLGIDRLFMMKAGIDDIRQIFSQDLNWLRGKEVI